MLYVDFETSKGTYKLRLNTRNVVVLEKQLGMNVLGIFGDGSQIPTVSTMVAILHMSLQQYHHGITLNDAYDIFDDYLATGKTVTDFLTVVIDIYKVSGIIANDVEEKN